MEDLVQGQSVGLKAVNILAWGLRGQNSADHALTDRNHRRELFEHLPEVQNESGPDAVHVLC